MIEKGELNFFGEYKKISKGVFISEVMDQGRYNE
jgi:hypothetical protein